MGVTGNDSLGVRRTLSVNSKDFDYFSLKVAEEKGVGNITRLPYSMKVLV